MGFSQETSVFWLEKRAQGVAIANHIIEQSTIEVVSSETLLLINSDKVVFVLNTLTYLLNPNHNCGKSKHAQFYCRSASCFK